MLLHVHNSERWIKDSELIPLEASVGTDWLKFGWGETIW